MSGTTCRAHPRFRIQTAGFGDANNRGQLETAPNRNGGSRRALRLAGWIEIRRLGKDSLRSPDENAPLRPPNRRELSEPARAELMVIPERALRAGHLTRKRYTEVRVELGAQSP